ncbi:MAG TPA: LAGLIDADG family homing endonuclease [Tepidisphaeraceae bacterium]|jgi:ribonucleoside-diphosphate reductase alpha chain
MKINRRFTQAGRDVFSTVQWEQRTSRITNPDGSVVFEMKDAEIPASWSQLATDIMVSKYFRKAGVPQADGSKGPEKSARQVIHRLVGCWRFWGETHGYFDTAEDAQAFYDELCHMMLHQQCAPNSPQWFNTGLNWAYGITGPAQGHYYCDPKTGELTQSTNAYEHPQPHACFIQSVRDDLVGDGGIMDLWTREARLFKYGSGTGSNFSKVRGENEKLSGGGRSSGLMSFLKIGDRAAGAIKSGGTTRRAAKMVCLDLDHPDIEDFVNWKVREEIKVAALAEGMKVLSKDQQELAKKLKLKLDYDFNGEAYFTVSGQNSNNSVRIPNSFFEAIDNGGDWNLTYRITNKIAKTLKASDLWDQISFAAWRCADPGVQFDTTINQWHTAPNSGRINASNPCVTGDTRVLTPGGIWRRIDSMIHLPARLVTNVEGKEIHVTEGAFPSGHKDVYELKTESGYCLKLTADHKVWTKTRGWVPASQLTTADQVRLPDFHAATEQIGEPHDAELFHLVGLLMSQTNGNLNALHLGKCLPQDHAGRLAQYVVDHFIPSKYADDYTNELMLADGDAGGVDSSTLSLTIENRRVLSRLRAYVRTDHHATRLSDDAFTAGLAAQKHLLRGLFTADGVVTETTIELQNSSHAFLGDVQTLLLGFGIKAVIAGDVLRVAPESLVAFGRHIGVLSGDKLQRLACAIAEVTTTPTPNNGGGAGHWDAFASLTHLGAQQVFDLTEPVTHSFIANGVTVHNCSEYMFLDDTACNLASLNVLTFFDSETRSFDLEGFKHGTRLWTTVLEISVLMASFPSEAIARLSYKFRTLGLGYANLGAMLMQAGIPYDSEKGRAICAALTAVLTGESYATSAEMAREHGPFAGYAENKPDMLRVIRNHRRAAYDVRHDKAYERTLGDYEGLDIKPVGIDASQFEASDTLASRDMLLSAQECWDRALFLGEKHGYRNAQSTVIAPTGTIGLLMDCDTTGVEPDFALVKFKKLAGGGYFKIANQSLEPALVNLGYSKSQVGEILNFVLGTLTLDGSPHINRTSLKARGFTNEVLDAIEKQLPGTFELGFAFNGWALGEAFMTQMGIPAETWQAPKFNLLRHLGFSKKEIDAASDHICGRGTVEGAPHLKPEHLPVFDCANKCGKTGQRFIHADGHIRMMATAQPFISGAISKTINLPNEATVEDIKAAYRLSWELGLKANALYRDGSKLSQPLNIKSDEDADKASEDDDADNVKAAQEEVANDVAGMASSVAMSETQNITRPDTRIVERIIERVVERPLRRRLPDTRNAITHKFDVAGHEGYITVGLYEDNTPGEMFITMAKEGSTIGGLMDTVATLVSVALQYGVPVESLLRKFEHTRFEPNGMTRNPEIPMAKSLTDYIFRWMGMEFVPGYRAANAPQRPQRKIEAPTPNPTPRAGSVSSETAHDDHDEAGPDARHDTSPDAKPFDYGSGLTSHAQRPARPTASAPASPRMSQSAALDPLSQQGTQMQSDAPACDVCGSITVRSGTCYKCQNCGNSMGCS